MHTKYIGDNLYVEPLESSVGIYTTNGINRQDIASLDKAEVEKLFRWLGSWLIEHRGEEI